MLRRILKKIFGKPKRVAVLASLLVLGLVPLVASAGWGPDRPIKDWNKPADRTGFNHVVFNSFIHTPYYGEEPAFYDAKNANITHPGGFADKVNVKPGETLLLRTYVHNNANQSLNASGKGVAKNTQVRVFLPTAQASSLRSISYISADNAAPKTVVDTVDFTGNTAFALQYVPGSARAVTNGRPSGYKVADSIVTSGAKVGYRGPDGTVPGCFQYTMVVTLKVKVVTPKVVLEKHIRIDGQKDWKKDVHAKPGDTVDYLLTVTNKGNDVAHAVAVGDTLPKGETYVPGTAELVNKLHPSGVKLSNALFSNGVIIGDYAPTANGFVFFKATLPKAKALKCGENQLVNTAVMQYNGGQGKDTAKAEVSKQCKPPVHHPPKPGTPPSGTLPDTGPADAAATGLASTGLGVALRSYLKGRKALKAALNG